MATIRKRQGPRGVRWQAIVRLAGCDPVRRTFASRAEARTWGRDEEVRLERLRGRGTRRRTLADAIERYIHTALPEKADTTQRTDERRLRWWYENHGHVELDRLTPDVLTSALAGIRQQAGGATSNRYLAAVSSVLRRAHREWGWLSDNPAAVLSRYRESPGRIRWLTTDEVTALLDACERTWRPELRVLAAIAFATGMRQGEILGLRWEDVDLTGRLIVLHKTKNRDRRGIPISAPLLAELRSLPRRLDTPYLFPAARPLSKERWGTYRKAWRKAVRDAGLRDFRFHDTRHTAASHLAMSGASERTIMEILGLRTSAMARRYSHLSSSHLADAVERLSTHVLPPAGSDRSS